MAEHGNERKVGSYGKEKREAGENGFAFSPLPVFPSAPTTTLYSFERATGDEAGSLYKRATMGYLKGKGEGGGKNPNT